MLQLREKLQLLETSWPICSWCCCYHQQGGVQLGGAAQAFSWACLSCPVELLAPPLLFQVYKQAMGEKRSCLQHCESSLCCGSLWREAQSWAAATPVCSTQRWLQKGGRKRLSRAVSVCLSAWPCPFLQHIWGNAETLLHLLSKSGTFPQCWEQLGMPGHLLWLWRHFSHHLLLPRKVLGNLGISHFPVEVTALHTLTHCISQWLCFWGRWEDTMKLLGQSFFISVRSLFHSSVFYLDYEYLSSQSFWFW